LISAGAQQQEGSAWVTSTGEFLKKLMTKFWIWVVAISLFVIGITGNRITVFRIIYMGLFLVFILTFQVCAIHFSLFFFFLFYTLPERLGVFFPVFF